MLYPCLGRESCLEAEWQPCKEQGSVRAFDNRKKPGSHAGWGWGGSGSQVVLLKTAGMLSLERRCVEPGPCGEMLPDGYEQISVGLLCRR